MADNTFYEWYIIEKEHCKKLQTQIRDLGDKVALLENNVYESGKQLNLALKHNAELKELINLKLKNWSN